MIKILLFSVLIIAISVALLSVKLIFRKNGKFSSQHVHDNPGLRKQGIHCVVDQDREARQAGKAYWEVKSEERRRILSFINLM